MTPAVVGRVGAALVALAAGALVGNACTVQRVCTQPEFFEIAAGVYDIERPELHGMEAGTVTIGTIDDPVSIEYLELDTQRNIQVVYRPRALGR